MVPCSRLAPLKGVFLPHTHLSWNRLCIHHDPDQDNVINENELMIKMGLVVLQFSSDSSSGQ